MEVYQDPGLQYREDPVELDVDVHPGQQDVAGIDEQDVVRPEPGAELGVSLLQETRDPRHAEAFHRDARCRVDAGKGAVDATVPQRPGQEARGIARADLDDPFRADLAHQGISGRAVEGGKHRLAPGRVPLVGPEVPSSRAGAWPSRRRGRGRARPGRGTGSRSRHRVWPVARGRGRSRRE